MSANGAAPLSERTKALLDKTGYPHDIHPGQRRYGPRPGHADPPKDAEIFLGKIPKDCFEDELVPLLESCGEIHDIRLMMVPHENECNKGFAFVRMVDRAAALDCVAKLDKYEIRPGKELGVCISESNCRLFIAGIPKDKTKDEILEEFSNACNGVLDIVFYADPKDPNRNRGFCFVDFDSHGNAANCRKRVLSSRLTVWNKSNLVCEWAIPQEEPDDQIMAKVKTLFVKHIADSVTQGKLEELFNQYGQVEKINRIKDYAFIFFESRDCATSAQTATNGMDLMGSHISVSLAKPAAKNKDAPPKSGYKMGSGNEGYRTQMRRGRGPRMPRGHWDIHSDPGYYDPWGGYGNSPPPMPPYDYGPPGDDYYHGGPPMVSYPTPHSSMGRGRGGPKRSQGNNRRGGRGGSRFEGGSSRPSGNKGVGSNSRGRGRGPPRGGAPSGGKQSHSQHTQGGHSEYKQDWSGADYSAQGYESYPGYNQTGYGSGSWSEDYTSDTWQQPGKRAAPNTPTPDSKRAHYQQTTPTSQWPGQYQAPASYPAAPQPSQWSAQTWTPQQSQAQTQSQSQQQAAWGYQGWKQ